MPDGRQPARQSWGGIVNECRSLGLYVGVLLRAGDTDAAAAQAGRRTAGVATGASVRHIRFPVHFGPARAGLLTTIPRICQSVLRIVSSPETSHFRDRLSVDNGPFSSGRNRPSQATHRHRNPLRESLPVSCHALRPTRSPVTATAALRRLRTAALCLPLALPAAGCAVLEQLSDVPVDARGREYPQYRFDLTGVYFHCPDGTEVHWKDLTARG
jgi:hypothetical protein